MLEQVPVPVRRLREPLEELRKLRDVVTIEHRELIHVRALVRMMRGVVESFRDTAARIACVAVFTRQHQRRNARDLGFERQHLEVDGRVAAEIY